MKQKEDPMVLEVPVKNKMVYHEDDRAQRLLDVFPLDKGQYSLTELYNKGLKEAKNDIVVFCHDDILFNKNGWARRLLTHFNTTDEHRALIGHFGEFWGTENK